MTDQQSQGDFAAGERTERQGPARDFAEGEERQRATPLAVVPPRPAAADPKDTEPS